MGMSHVSYIGLPQMGPTFITDEFFITPGMGRGCKTHHRLRELVTIISKQQVILRGFYATRPWALTLGLKCYYRCRELYHAWVLVITLVLSTDVARSTMGLVWINKIWAKTKTIQVQLLLYQSAHVCVRVYYDSLCQMLLRDLKTIIRGVFFIVQCFRDFGL